MPSPYTEEVKEKNRLRYHALKQNDPFRHKCLYIKIKAKREGLLFDLTPEHLENIWDGRCAISGMQIELHNHRNEENHAELDRIFPSKGYVQDNVKWMNRRFNRLKGDASFEDSRLITNFLEAYE